MWFDSWFDLSRIVIIGILSYITIMVILRLTGKRTLSQLNAFDFIITVALGSTMASIILSSDVSYSEGLLAMSLLAGLQLVVAWLSSRSKDFRKTITSQPALLVKNGQVLPGAIKEHRLSEAGVRQAVRMSGVGGLDKVAAVVLEANGKISVITKDSAGDHWALQDVNDPVGKRGFEYS
ncbi:membrane protein [Corynebacterium phocae]|uniref:Membrane protein n=1 Tax=Corynebacterium phocae TaxID=161895 RepID=A0A1L7D123_9CORY|nr:YetF domain-containing protein [Corynebacterium phocae]APT91849.1 membrane protein [Corynebacterium phocae]KAA8727459.1 DUF421 domain-containing protein [Corynebacterium phocae]